MFYLHETPPFLYSGGEVREPRCPCFVNFQEFVVLFRSNVEFLKNEVFGRPRGSQEHPERPFGAPRALLERSGAVFWVPQDAPGGARATPGCSREAIWGALGGPWATFSVLFGVKVAP